MDVKEHSHFGVYALILNAIESEILLIKKSRGPYIGRLDLPGGGQEGSETFFETLIREVKEETGVEIEAAQDIGLLKTRFEYIKDYQPRVLMHTGRIFLSILENKSVLDVRSSDSDGCLWVPIENISKYRVTPFVLEAVIKVKQYK